MWYVYRGVNHSTGEVYFGVSQDPERRVDGSHCAGHTKTIRHWICGFHRIVWVRVSAHREQFRASSRAHQLERTYFHPQGFHVFQTAGI